MDTFFSNARRPTEGTRTMSIGKLGNTDALAILREGTLGRLGCIAAGWPYVVPVNYYFDGENIYIHTLPGKKLDALRVNPRVCLQVNEIKDPYDWRSVIAYGTFEEISNEETYVIRRHRSITVGVKELFVIHSP